MKTELRIAPHKYLPGVQVIELWFAGEFIGTVTGRDGPGVRVISKYMLFAPAKVVIDVDGTRSVEVLITP